MSNLNRSMYPIGIKRELIPYRCDGKWGYFDQDGRVRILPYFDDADGFSEGLAGVRIADRWGYINDQGTMVIAPEFEFVGPFYNKVAIVENVKGNYILINQNGMMIKSIQEQFKIDEPIELAISNHGLIRIRIEDKIGYLNYNGEIVIPPRFAEAGPFNNGLAWVRFETDHYCFINASGETVINLPANFIPDCFSEGLAAIRDRNSLKSGYIDAKGNIVIEVNLSNLDYFSEGLSVVYRDGKMGYINSSGQLAVTAQYDEAFPFINEVALVTIQDRSGFINKNGEIVVPLQKFDYVDMQLYLEDTNLVLVLQDGIYKYINRYDGKCVFETK